MIISRNLAKENPSKNEVGYARMLIAGIYFLKRNSKRLKRAKRIIDKYPNNSQAIELLEFINNL